MQQSDTITIDTNKTLKSFKAKTSQKLSAPMKATKKDKDQALEQIKKQMNNKISSSQIKTMNTKSTSKNKEDKIEKENVIRVILKYETNARFGSMLNKELGFKHSRAQLMKKSLDDLNLTLHRIRTHLNTRNMDQVFNHMVKQTAKGYEDIVTNFGYDIQGFESLLLSNPAFWDAFERWKIEQKIPDVPPSLQLMYLVASTTFVAHQRNQSQPSGHPNGNVAERNGFGTKPILKSRKDLEIIDADDK